MLALWAHDIIFLFSFKWESHVISVGLSPGLLSMVPTGCPFVVPCLVGASSRCVGGVGVSSDVLPFSCALVFPMYRHLRTSRLGLHGPAQKMSHRVRVRLWPPLQGVQAFLSSVNTQNSFSPSSVCCLPLCLTDVVHDL